MHLLLPVSLSSDFHYNQKLFVSLIELWFSFESKIVQYVHVNENGLVRAGMVCSASGWFRLMVRKNLIEVYAYLLEVIGGALVDSSWVRNLFFVRTYFWTVYFI